MKRVEANIFRCLIKLKNVQRNFEIVIAFRSDKQTFGIAGNICDPHCRELWAKLCLSVYDSFLFKRLFVSMSVAVTLNHE